MYFMSSPIGLELFRSLDYSYHILTQLVGSINALGLWGFSRIQVLVKNQKTPQDHLTTTDCFNRLSQQSKLNRYQQIAGTNVPETITFQQRAHGNHANADADDHGHGYAVARCCAFVREADLT